MDWRHHAACRDEDPELFFPVGDSGPALAQVDEAKRVCLCCPVSGECLVWTLGTGQDHGVWGGMSESERRALKRRDAEVSSAAAAIGAPVGLDVETKLCSGPCQQRRPLDVFGVDRNAPDGLTYWCKTCRSTRKADRRRARQGV